MRKHTTIDIDQELVRQAAAALGTTRMSETVHAALEDVVRRRRREDIFVIPTDLDAAMLEGIRSHRFAESSSSYASAPRRGRSIDHDAPSEP